MQNTDPFTDLGLSKQEALVYVSALTIGPNPASIIAKKASLKRTTVYPILKTLAQKGFISVTFKGRERFYTAQRPQKLVRYYEKRVQSLINIVPQLNQLSSQAGALIGLRSIETATELRSFYEEILEEYKNREYYIIGDTQTWENIDPGFFDQYVKDRAAAKIKTYLILTHDSKPAIQRNQNVLRTTKYLPEQYVFKSTMNIFKDKILIMSTELTSLAVVIEIPAMTDIFKSIFDLLWDMLPEA